MRGRPKRTIVAHTRTAQAGDTIEILKYDNAEWATARVASRPAAVGLVPLNYLSAAMPAAVHATATPSGGSWCGRIVTAIADYRSDSKDDLWFSAGDQIKVIEVRAAVNCCEFTRTGYR